MKLFTNSYLLFSNCIEHSRNIVLTIALFTCTLFSFGQDIHFSHQEFAPMILNPALVGAKYNHFASIIHRNQWRSITTPFTTTYAGYDQRIKLTKGRKDNGFLALGVNFYSDKAGDANMGVSQGQISVGYHVRLAENQTLGLALQPGFANRSIDISGIQWGTQYELGSGYNGSLSADESVTGQSISYFDLGAGIVYSFKSEGRFVTINEQKHLNIGAAIHHINAPETAFGFGNDALKQRISFFADGTYSIPNTNMAILPGVYYNIQGKQQELLLGSYIRYLLQRGSEYTGLLKGSALSLGAFARARDAVSLKLLLEYQKYAVGFAYDINTSKLKTASNLRGGVEVVIKFASPNPFGVGGGATNKSVKFL